jgi:XTP/dITP diphosphohydrolase
MRWVLATANPHKARELEAIFAAAGAPVALEYPSPPSGPTGRPPPPTALAATGRTSLADDSGLEVDALGGEPGVFSARYAGVSGPGADDANNARLLAELEGIHGPNRRARFRCVLVLAAPGVPELVAQGAIEGFVLPALRGPGGFGYDPLFQPEGDARSLAEFAPEEKNRVSHRGQAARQLLALLAGRAGGPAPP